MNRKHHDPSADKDLSGTDMNPVMKSSEMLQKSTLENTDQSDLRSASIQQEKLLSVIVPMYKEERYIEKCLSSILIMDMPGMEILAVDDGSPDRCAEIAGRMAEKDSRLRVISQSNEGSGGARNKGIAESSGKYLLFVDGDDSIDADVVSRMVDRMERENLDMLCGKAVMVSENGSKSGVMEDRFSTDTVLDPAAAPELLTVLPSACLKMVRRSIASQPDCRFPGKVWFEDLRTTPKWIAKCRRIGFCDQPFYRYLYNRSGSIMNSTSLSRQHEIVDALEDLQQWFREHGLADHYSKELEFLWIQHGYLYGINRIARIDSHSPLISEIRTKIETSYPDFASSPYLQTLSSKEKTLLHWIEKNRLWKIVLADRIKRRLNAWIRH